MYAGELQTRELQGCPQCRVPLWPDAKPNRGFLGVLKKLRLPCGSCTSPLLMGCREAATHALECANSRIRCPMHTGRLAYRTRIPRMRSPENLEIFVRLSF